MNKEIRNNLNDILINKKVRDNMNFVFTVIPELTSSIGFDQNHPHHHLDVWCHTLLALDNANSNDLEINMAILLHDIGKPFSYQDEEVRHFYGHEYISSLISKDVLTRLGYDESFINDVCYLVKNHDSIINIDEIVDLDLTKKLLHVQYADAKAHNPDKVEMRTKELDEVKKDLSKVKIRK